ncbi:unnamed protein product [Sphagnum tenellum]
MGGKSIEREVSFNSGRTICDHLDTQYYTVVPLFQTAEGHIYHLPWQFLHRGKISDFSHRLHDEATRISWDGLKKLVDFVYLAMHGRYAEDGTVQGMLEVLNIPYLGTKVFGSALGMDKVIQKSYLASNGIGVAKGINLSPSEAASFTLPMLLKRFATVGLTFPVVVKPAHEGSSLGIRIISYEHELIAAVTHASTIDGRFAQAIVIEEKLEGMEFVCVSLERRSKHNGTLHSEWFSLPLTEVVIESGTELFDYEQKYMPGRALKITPARCTAAQQDMIASACLKATKLLNFSTISRIDGFLTTDGRVVIIDPNTLTGMSPTTFIFNQAAEYGMSHTGLINFMIENELLAYGLIESPSADLTKDSAMKTTAAKTRVAVLLGGDSNEREISLESGRNICYKLSPHLYDVLPLFINDAMEIFHIPQRLLIKNATRAIADLVTTDMQLEWSALPELCDFVFIALHGGKGEAGAVQGCLEMLGIPYNGSSVLTSSLCMDKFKTNNFLRGQGFHVPSSLLITKEEWFKQEGKQQQSYLKATLASINLSLPVILKPHDDGCSVMVEQIDTFPKLASALDVYFTSNKTTALVEELIKGIELTCGVLGNDTVTALPPSCKGYARIDCFYQPADYSPTGSDRIIVLEINTLPGMTPATCIFHQAAEVGIQPMQLIDRIVQLGLELHAPVEREHKTTPATRVVEDMPSPITVIEPEEPIMIAAAFDSDVLDEGLVEEEEEIIVIEEPFVPLQENKMVLKEATVASKPKNQEEPPKAIVNPTDFMLKMF